MTETGDITESDRGQQAARILVVEDERIVARDLADTLAALGYVVVDIVATGEEAIERARTHRPSAILMDIRLAGKLDGIEAAARVRAERDVPVIYLTAHADEDTLRRAKLTAPLGYLVKPFRSPELRCALEIAIHRHEIDARLRVREQWLTMTLRSIGDGVVATDAQQHVTMLNAELEHRVVARTEQLEAANKELEAFSWSVAHDLRAPLRGIDGFSQALIEDHAPNLGPEGVAHLRCVRAAAHRMAQLIDDLLRLSRVARTELQRQPVDLSRLARIVTTGLQQAHPDRAIEVAVQDGVVVEGDDRLLRIVLENLFDNAWKFTSKTARPQIAFGALERAGERVYFVRDNGAGFAMQYAHKLFGAFQRLHLVSEFEGTGLGLTTVQRIIDRHGGRIWAESSVGRSTTFYFVLDGLA